MNSAVPIKKISMMPFVANLPKGKHTNVTFQSLPKPKYPSRVSFDDFINTQKYDATNTSTSVRRLQPSAKSLPYSQQYESDQNYRNMAMFDTRLNLPRADEDYDLDFTPYEYDDTYGHRPQTSYMSVPFASRNRLLESIAECRTPSSSSASSRGGDVTPDDFSQILDVRRETLFSREDTEFLPKSAPIYESRVVVLPKLQKDQTVTPVRVKPVLSLRNKQRLPSIQSAAQRLESSETFLAHSRFTSQSRSESVESIRTPSTSRHLLWSRGSILSDGGFNKTRSDTTITRLSHQSEPTPIIPNDFPKSGKAKRKKKGRRKAATKVYVPSYQSFLDTVAGNNTDDPNAKKRHIRSANFTLYFPSIHKKCTITSVRKEGKWCSK